MRLPLVVMQHQRHQADCTVAALAMYLGTAYEDVLLAFQDPTILRGGAWLAQVQRAAARLGVELKRKRIWDPEQDEGVAQVRRRRGPHHVVVIREGLAFDTDLTVWLPADYLVERRALWGSLLVRADE